MRYTVLLLLVFFCLNSALLYSKSVRDRRSTLQLREQVNFTAEEESLWNSLLYTYQLLKKASIFTNKNSATNLIFSAINGMVNSLDDPYSVLLQGQTLDQFVQDLDNHYSGIGIYIVTNELGIKIVDVIPDSPAWVIGLNANDIIIQVEGESIVGIDIDKIRNRLLGLEGSLVNITVLRGDKKLSFNVVRRDIKVKTVYAHKIGEGEQYGYIRIINFGQQTVEEFKDSLTKLKNERIRGLVIDLRNNPGGLLSAVAEMIDFFITKGVVVSTTKVGNVQDKIGVHPTMLFPSFIPVIVLINKYSASASEIFAGAMRDHERGVLLGEKSYGKFSVQQLFPIYQDPEDKNHAVLKLTIAKYFLPKGDSYEHIGISPDVFINKDGGIITNTSNTTNTTDNLLKENNSYTLPSPFKPPPMNEAYLSAAIKILVDTKLYQEYLKKP